MLSITVKNVLSQLADSIEQLSNEEFKTPLNTFNGASVGQHVRHTLEFFTCFMHGVKTGVVNYDKREHDKEIESSKEKALKVIEDIIRFVETDNEDLSLKLAFSYEQDQEFHYIDTTYQRELVYNIEHAIHHMAIIKIGFREAYPNVSLAGDYGVASSTVQYQRESAASNC